MIGEGATRRSRPTPPAWQDGYAKGAASSITATTTIKPLGYIYDSFGYSDLPDWVNVYGKLAVTGGGSSDVYGNALWYSAGRHKTQLLSDSCRAKVTIQDGIILNGESRVWVCGDEMMNRYYGIALRINLLSTYIYIIRGTSSISVEKFEETATTVTNGDEFEVWFDRINSTVRAYKNGAEVASKYFPPNDIPHGPGSRYCGIVMDAHWLLDHGPHFDDFTAWDVAAPLPAIYDPIDGPTVLGNWTPKENTVELHDHLFVPKTLGPEHAFWTDAAILWDTEIGTDSAKLVFSVVNVGAGKFFVALCSNAAMTNWVGIEFETGIVDNRIHTVLGTGPTARTRKGERTWSLSQTGTVFTVTWDNPTETISVYKGADLSTPLLSWQDSGSEVINGAGNRYVGMMWQTSLFTPGVEPSSFEVYEVTGDAPLP